MKIEFAFDDTPPWRDTEPLNPLLNEMLPGLLDKPAYSADFSRLNVSEEMRIIIQKAWDETCPTIREVMQQMVVEQ